MHKTYFPRAITPPMTQQAKRDKSFASSTVVWSLPDHACDSHIHVYGPLDRYPPPAKAKYSIPDARPEHLFALHDLVGISRAVVVNAAEASPDNQRLFDVLRQYPHRLRGVATVPDDAPTDKQLEDWDKLGVRAVRFSYVGTQVDTLDERFIARISELGWHVQIQMENDQILE